MRGHNWKFKREINRLKMQIMQIPWFLSSSFIRRKYDNRTNECVKITDGKCSVKNNIAILLLYQPSGLSKSTFSTLEHLDANEFSPVVVSNCPLSEEDMGKLKETSLVILERPNYGYDFGGYRQGIKYLRENQITPDNLLILNDSIWFPLRRDCSFLSEVQNQTFDLYGIVMNTTYRNAKRHHIQSYLFSFKRRVLISPEFEQYWDNIFLSNNKYAVVRQCEIKMTEYFRSRGFTAGSKYTMNNVYDALNTFAGNELDKIIAYQRIVDPKRTLMFERQMASRDERVLDTRSRQWLGKYFLISHPLVLFKILRCPVLKRDKQFIYQVQRKAIFEAGLDKDLLEVVKEEIKHMG